jgi:glycosyltransferase involved in cell wall biosynthesis
VGVSKYDEINLLEEKINRNVYIVYNGISIPNVNSTVDIPQFNTDKPIVLSIARVAAPKRADIFVEVSRMLPDYEFIWVGNQKEVTEFGQLPPNCHFVGNIPNAGALCAKAHLLMLSSNYEGLPMVILEAMSFGKPIVASNVGGVSEIVCNDINGYALENNAELFAEKIKYILENQQVRDNMSKASKEMYDNNFTVDKMVDGYKDVYNKVLAKKSF